MIADHCTRSDRSQFLLPFQGSVLQHTDHVTCQHAHIVLYWSLAHNCRANQKDRITLLAAQAHCAELLKCPKYIAFGLHPHHTSSLEWKEGYNILDGRGTMILNVWPSPLSEYPSCFVSIRSRFQNSSTKITTLTVAALGLIPGQCVGSCRNFFLPWISYLLFHTPRHI